MTLHAPRVLKRAECAGVRAGLLVGSGAVRLRSVPASALRRLRPRLALGSRPRRQGGGEAGEYRVRPSRSRSHLRQEERGDEEGVGGKLDDPKLAVFTEPAQPEPIVFESLVICGVDAVVASIVLESRFGTVECGSPRARNDFHALLYPNEGAGERGDDEALGIWVCSGMIGILEPEDVARELDDRVLEAASGADEWHHSFAREADRCQDTRHAPVGMACRCDQETGVPGQALLRALGRHLAAGHPLKTKAELRERPSRGMVSFVAGVKIADDPNQRTFHVDGASVTPLWLSRDRRERPVGSLEAVTRPGVLAAAASGRSCDHSSVPRGEGRLPGCPSPSAVVSPPPLDYRDNTSSQASNRACTRPCVSPLFR